MHQATMQGSQRKIVSLAGLKRQGSPGTSFIEKPAKEKADTAEAIQQTPDAKGGEELDGNPAI